MPDPIPFRLRVLQALTAQMKTVTPANGYLANLADYTDEANRPAARVFRGRSMYGESDLLPFVSILEDPRPVENMHATGNRTQQVGEWKLLIQGFAKEDPVNPLDPAYFLMADIIKAVIAAKAQRHDILGLGSTMPCVTDLKITQATARPADGEVSDVAFCFVAVTLTLVEDLETPFA